jgi:hypothetical protein
VLDCSDFSKTDTFRDATPGSIVSIDVTKFAMQLRTLKVASSIEGQETHRKSMSDTNSNLAQLASDHGVTATSSSSQI